jgi:iron complex transport system substrate-binding protein
MTTRFPTLLRIGSPTVKRSSLSRSALLAAAVLFLAGCAGGGQQQPAAEAPPSPAAASAFPVTVEHTLGSTTIDSEPQRIVTLGTTDADVALALGVTPVGIRSLYNFEKGVGPWAEEALGTATPQVMGRELNYEAIAALQPDLILNVYSGADPTEHENLTRIAPTVGLPTGAEPYAPTWQDATTTIATALGREADGQALVEETEQYLAGVKSDHPAYAGRTATYIDAFGAEAYVGGPTATTVKLMEAIGFEPVPFVRDYSAPGSQQIPVSGELLGQVDADVLIMFTYGNTLEAAIAQNPGLGTLSAVTEGRAYVQPDLSLSAPSTLSIPYGVDALLPFLDKATAQAPAN